MARHWLDRPHRNRMAHAAIKLGQCAKLNRVANCPEPVRFKQRHVFRVNACIRISAFHRQLRPVFVGRKHAAPAAVADNANPFDDRVDWIVVTQRVVEPLEDDHADPFA